MYGFLVFDGQQQQVTMRSTDFTAVENSAVIAGFEQPLVFTKRSVVNMAAHFGPMALGGESLTALGATAVQYLPTSTSGHAGAEAMPALALDPAGLIGPFHASAPSCSHSSARCATCAASLGSAGSNGARACRSGR